ATDWLQLHASYAQAFRAPSIQEMYVGGRHDFGAMGYADFRPNPQLQAETAANKEIGLRAHWQQLLAQDDELRFELTAFRNDVDNYIESYMELAGPPGPPPMIFNIGYRNAGEVRLEGYEAK